MSVSFNTELSTDSDITSNTNYGTGSYIISDSPKYQITIVNDNFKFKNIHTCVKCILNTNSIILGLFGLLTIITSYFIYTFISELNNEFIILLTIGVSAFIFSILTCISVTKISKTYGICIITLFTIYTSLLSLFSFVSSVIYSVFLDGYYRNTTTMKDILGLSTNYINNLTHNIYDICCNNTNIYDMSCNKLIHIVSNHTIDCHSYNKFYNDMIEYVLYTMELTVGVCGIICILTLTSSIMTCFICKKYRQTYVYIPK